ncbi:MAG: hypothetical protein JWP89_5349 [Schlesneria sp.]|nr:hypothetical protein [Schlesneria sp.]
MTLYFNVTTLAATVQSKIVPVTCEKCGCDYYYEMTRFGAGVNVAHFGFSAGLSAGRQAKTEANKRLSHDAELVPCPTCNWINDDLIQRYRNARFRYLDILAISLAVVGCAGALIWALVVYGTPAADRTTIPYIIGGGWSVGILSALALLLLQARFKRQLQPNRLYPQAPSVPVGTPPALLMDEHKELVLARPDAKMNASDAPAGSFDFFLGRHAFPNICCLCLKAPDSRSAINVDVAQGTNFEIPRCVRCCHVALVNKIIRGLIATSIAFLVPAAILFQLSAEAELWIVCGASAIAIGWTIAEFAGRPVPSKAIDSSRGIMRLFNLHPEFRSQIVEMKPAEEAAPDFSFLNQIERSG